MASVFTLTIPNPPQYDAVIDTKLESSIFHDMYCGAIRNVKDIISKNKQILAKAAENSTTLSPENSTINTAIAFVGGRGTGKSSAMQSFRAFLHEPPGTRKKNNPSDKFDVGDETFFALSTIDSSQISEEETVLGRMSASMLDVFEKCKKDLSVEEKQKFMQHAKEVNELSVMIRDGKWFQCGDKLLSDTRKICNMRNKVCALVDLYLKIVDKSHLVITIDDLDMSIPNAHAIMEEIRQYLSIPHVIVLVSMDEDLLDAVMNATIANSFGEHSKGSAHKSVVKDLSYRYLEKLFPVNRRHYTPVLNAKQLREWKADFYGKPEYAIRDAVLQLIWRKTMMLPVCNQDGDHLLIPHNLRSLYNMVVLLRNMPDVAYKSESSDPRTREDFANADATEIREQLRHNLKVFGQYIVANIASYGAPRLNSESEIGMVEVLENVIHQMMEVPLTDMNAMIVGDILYHISNIENTRDIYKLVLGNSVKHYSRFNLLSPAIRYPDAISLGDVMFVLGELDSCSKCSYIRYLVEVIRTLWSVRMTEELYVTYVVGSDLGEIKTTEAFRHVVGGFIINPDYMDEFLENGGWKEYDEAIKSVSSEMAKHVSIYQGGNNPTKTTWHESRQGGRAYYHLESPSPGKSIWCHPFAIYSYLLRKPYKEHDMVLPFHSFDFMCRYYEELRQSICTENKQLTFEILTKKLLNEINTNQITSQIVIIGIPTDALDEFMKSLKATNKWLLSIYDVENTLLSSLTTSLNQYSSANTKTHPQLSRNIRNSINSINSRSLTGSNWESLYHAIKVFNNNFQSARVNVEKIADNKFVAEELLKRLLEIFPDLRG